MHKYQFLLLFLMLFCLISCSDSQKEEERFINTYREILIARETIADSILANKKVDSIINHYDYTQDSFRDAFFEIMKDNKNFSALIDSLRSSILKEKKEIE